MARTKHRHGEIVVFAACVDTRNRESVGFALKRWIGNDDRVAYRESVIHGKLLGDNAEKLARSFFKHRTIHDGRGSVDESGHRTITAISDHREISRCSAHEVLAAHSPGEARHSAGAKASFKLSVGITILGLVADGREILRAVQICGQGIVEVLHAFSVRVFLIFFEGQRRSLTHNITELTRVKATARESTAHSGSAATHIAHS